MQFDLAKTFGDQKKFIYKKLLPALKSVMNPSLNAYDTKIVKVIKQLHKSRCEIWKLKQKEEQIEKHNKKQHVASRRDQVRNLLSKIKLHAIINFFFIEVRTASTRTTAYDLYERQAFG